MQGEQTILEPDFVQHTFIGQLDGEMVLVRHPAIPVVKSVAAPVDIDELPIIEPFVQPRSLRENPLDRLEMESRKLLEVTARTDENRWWFVIGLAATFLAGGLAALIVG